MVIAKSRAIDLTGMVFERLTVVNRVENSKYVKWHCICECGKEVDVYGKALRNGTTKSCGCYTKDRLKKHGLSHTKLHGVWWGMMQRCYYEKHVDYKWYAEKGIGVCDEWRNDFKAFYDWAMENGYKEGLSIDRIDNDKGYSPQNCRFATPQEQANNRTTNIVIEYNGKSQTLKQWAAELDIKYSALYDRYRRGMSFEEAIQLPQIH